MGPSADGVEHPRPRALRLLGFWRRIERPGRSARAAALAGVGIVVTAALALWLARPAPFARQAAAVSAKATPLLYSAPVAWRLASGVLQVLDADGRELFSRDLGIACGDSSSDSVVDGHPSTAVQFADIDADGRDEVVVVPPTVDPAASRLYCFEYDGDPRFTYQPKESVRFGETSYEGPWWVAKAVVTTRADGSHSLWVVTRQATQFPSSLKELDSAGGVRREYWSAGLIEHVSEHRWRGKDVVLVGAADEDRQASSLAVFERDEVAGSAPALRAGFDCTSCALAGPSEYLVFPRSCQAAQATPVWDAWVEPGDRLSVVTELARVPDGGADPPRPVFAYYTFDSGLSLVQAEISREFQVLHRALEKRRLVDHAFGPRDDAALFPVLRFNGIRHSALPAVPVGH